MLFDNLLGRAIVDPARYLTGPYLRYGVIIRQGEQVTLTTTIEIRDFFFIFYALPF
jgi:hypothetical protein